MNEAWRCFLLDQRLCRNYFLPDVKEVFRDGSFQKAVLKILFLSKATHINLCFYVRHPGEKQLLQTTETVENSFCPTELLKMHRNFKKCYAYCFSKTSGHIGELQFSIQLNPENVYTPTHLSFTFRNSFLMEVPREKGTS